MIKYLKEHMNKKVRHPYHIQGGPACLNARSILGHLWGIGCSPDLEFVSHILIVKSSQRDVANKRCQGSYWYQYHDTDEDEDDVKGIYIFIENHSHGLVPLWPSKYLFR